MKYILHYVSRTIILNRRKSIITALFYFFASLFFVLQALFLFSWNAGNEKRMDMTYGVHDAVFAVKNADEFSSLDITKRGTIYVTGSAIRNEDYSDRPIVMGHADENAIALNCITLLEGNFPQNSNEIALERSFLSLVYPRSAVSDEITFTLSDGEERSMKICGVINNISNMQWNDRSVPMINALVSEDFSYAVPYSFVSVKFTDGTDVDTISKQLVENGSAIAYTPNQRNSDIMVITGISDSGAVFFIILLMLIVTALILLSITMISSRGNIMQAGMLKTAGFSVKTISLVFILRTAMLAAPCAILAGAAAFVSSFWISDIFGANQNAAQAGLVCILGVAGIFLLAVLFSYLSIVSSVNKPVIENLKPKASVTESGTNFTSQNPYVLYAVKSFLQNAGEITAACITVFISVVIMVFCSFIGVALLKDISSLTRPYDFHIDTAYTKMPGEVSSDSVKGITKTDYAALYDNPDTKQIIGMACFEPYELVDETIYSGTENQDESLMQTAKDMGYPDGYRLKETVISGVSDETLETLNEYVIKGKINISALKDGTQVISTDKNDNVGDRIRYAVLFSDNDEEKPRMLDFEVTVCAVADIKLAENASLIKELSRGNIWSIDAYDALNINAGYNRVALTVKDKQYFAKLAEVINDIEQYYKSGGLSLWVTDNIQQSESAQQVYNAFLAISKTVCVTLGVFSVISLISSLSAKISRRRRIFGALRAAGMTRAQLFKLLLTENLVYLAAAFLLGLLLGGGLCLAVSLLSGYSAAMFSMWEIAVYAPVYFALVILISLYASFKSFKTSVVESLKGVE